MVANKKTTHAREDPAKANIFGANYVHFYSRVTNLYQMLQAL
ncbi:hypothetical protein GbCGDNIH7_7146 [Granulibacter bethesdensis]|nr:hypothetical protein GbCGDNIH4_7146 [Granulibacter bethesdensis CGDNIH4]APH59482.1 hypothetical protein GbCGDNIH7_7146 [Granulibacter bethesdensis]